jgi:hypothetical protein
MILSGPTPDEYVPLDEADSNGKLRQQALKIEPPTKTCFNMLNLLVEVLAYMNIFQLREERSMKLCK